MLQNTQSGNVGIDPVALFGIIVCFTFAVGTNIVILIKRELNVPRIIRYIGMGIFVLCFIALIFLIYGWNPNKLSATISLVIFLLWFMVKFIFHKKETNEVAPEKNQEKSDIEEKPNT